MTATDLDTLRFPVGTFTAPDTISADQITNWLAEIAAFPSQVREAVTPLTDAQKAWRYRPEGWSIVQVVHHCADSHMNSINRFKHALTQDNPTIATYPEHLFAELHDSLESDMTGVLGLLDGLHYKWVLLLKSLNDAQLGRAYFHPDDKALVPLKQAIGVYAWHCRHHLAHIQQAIANKGAFGDVEAWTTGAEKPGAIGIGGIFYKFDDPDGARTWYQHNLGLNTDQWGTSFESRSSDNPGQRTFLQWSPMKSDTTHFDPGTASFMVNFRVRGIDALVEQLKQNGVTIIDQIARYDYGDFVHIMGPENQAIELWEPKDMAYDSIAVARTK